MSYQLIDQLLKDCHTPQDILGLLKELAKRLAERMLEAEMTLYFGIIPFPLHYSFKMLLVKMVALSETSTSGKP